MLRNRLILGEYPRLREALWEEIDRLQSSDRLSRVTVVAPSARLTRALKLEAIERRPDGCFGVRFTSLLRLAAELGGVADGSFLADSMVPECLLLDWMESEGAFEGESTAPAQGSPYEMAGALWAAVRDLRDAAVPTEPDFVIERLREAASVTGSRIDVRDVERLGALLRAHRHFAGRLLELGLTDRADVYARAAERATRIADPVFVYGFYDVIQVQADFIAALARSTSVSLLVPGGGHAETWRFGAWFRESFAAGITAETVQLEDPPAPPHPEVWSAVGASDEIWFCAKEIRALLDTGHPASSIAVVARSLDAYRREIDVVFGEHAIPYDGPAPYDLADHPLAQVIGALFRVGLRDAPATAVLDVVMHPAMTRVPERREWLGLARSLEIRRGADWRRLEGFREGGFRDSRTGREYSPDTVDSLWSRVRALGSDSLPRVAEWDEHARAHRELLTRWLDEQALSAEECEVVLEVREVLARLSKVAHVAGAVSRERFVDAFDRLCARRPLPRRNGHGVGVIDVMGMRGLSFSHVFLLGMNAHVFPRFILEEPFLSDAIRREVLRVLGHHLAVRVEGYDEERLLFHLVRSAARERFVCVFQRADSKGRLRDASPFLRPFLSAEVTGARTVPHADAAKRRSTYVRSPREATLWAHDTVGALAAFGRPADRYARGRAMLLQLEESGNLGAFEGCVGTRGSGRGAPLSATRLERYGECPFRYFGENELDLTRLPDLDGDDDLHPTEIGRMMHRLLEHLYKRLATEAFRPESLRGALEWAGRRTLAEVSSVDSKLEGLRAVRWTQIRGAVEAFARWDLRTLRDWQPRWFEEKATVRFAGGEFRARIDRMDRHRPSGRLRVIDYKRRFRPDFTTALDAQAKRGKMLQAPLYLEAGESIARTQGFPDAEAAEVVLYFIESYTGQVSDELPAEGRRFRRRLTAERATAAREAIEAAVGTLAETLRSGWFFPRPDDSAYGHCSRCDLATVCRKDHPGFRTRLEAARTGPLREYWQVVEPGGG